MTAGIILLMNDKLMRDEGVVIIALIVIKLLTNKFAVFYAAF